MAKAWGHSRSGIEGLRLDLISALAGAASPARLLHRLPSLNRVVPQQPSPSHRLWWAGRNVAVHPSGNSLSVDDCCSELEQTELLLLLGIKPPIIAQLLTHCCHQWKAVCKMESGGTVAT